MNRAEREAGQGINYGTPMGACTRRTFYPERAIRRAAWERRHPDPLVWKRFFACGEAAVRGWMVLVWANPMMRTIVRERIAVSRAVGPLPLP